MTKQQKQFKDLQDGETFVWGELETFHENKRIECQKVEAGWKVVVIDKVFSIDQYDLEAAVVTT